jgi:general stress protein 26
MNDAGKRRHDSSPGAQRDPETEKFEELIEQFDNAMLVTVADDGSLHSRPMAIAAHEGVARLNFATSRATAKVAEVSHYPRVAAVMQDDGLYLAVSGTARIVDDRARIEQLWESSWKLWFPAGPGDPRLVLIELEPERAEYWDRSGVRKLEYLWEAGKALATGRRVADEELSGHGKLSRE